MIETLQLAVNIEEEQLVTARKENWGREQLMQALEGLNETASNIRTARQYGRVSKKMERVLFKRLGKVAKGYMATLRLMEKNSPQTKIGPIKEVQLEEETGKDEPNLKPTINVDHAKMKNMLMMDRVMVREPDAEE